MTAREGNCAKSGLVVVVRRSGLNRAEKSDKKFGAAGGQLRTRDTNTSKLL